MTLRQMEELIMLQNDMCEMSKSIKDEDIFIYTIGLMIERWCKEYKISPAFVAKKLLKRLRRKK